MKIDELKNKTIDQLKSILIDLKKEAFNLRFQKANGQLENTSRVKVVKRSVARVLTLINNLSKKELEKNNMPKRILTGQVTSDSNNKTITVLVERRFTHPVLKKTIRKSKKYRAHDEKNTFKIGDIVRIRECSPFSKSKRWEVLTN